jgi:hypothetical protein
VIPRGTKRQASWTVSVYRAARPAHRLRWHGISTALAFDRLALRECIHTLVCKAKRIEVSNTSRSKRKQNPTTLYINELTASSI